MLPLSFRLFFRQTRGITWHTKTNRSPQQPNIFQSYRTVTQASSSLSSSFTSQALTPHPHTHTVSVLPSVLTAQLITAQLDRECVGKSVGLLQLKFLFCVTLGTAEDLTAQFTLDCSVFCFLKAEALSSFIVLMLSASSSMATWSKDFLLEFIELFRQ